MSAVVVTNAILKSMAHCIKEATIEEVTGTLRSLTLKDVPHRPILTFVEDIPNNGIVVTAWVNKVKIAQQTYRSQSEKPWMTLDMEFEHRCYLGLVNYFYSVLRQHTAINDTVKDLLEKGNGSIKLPNGQTLKSAVRHGEYERSVSLSQKDGDSICSLQVDVSELSIGHILSTVNFHWTDPGRLYPDNHGIEINPEWFETFDPNAHAYP